LPEVVQMLRLFLQVARSPPDQVHARTRRLDADKQKRAAEAEIKRV